MAAQQFIQRRPMLTVVICLVVLAAAISYVFARTDLFTARYSNLVYYYDLKTGELFAAAWQDQPRIGPSGNAGVVANVYACGTCDDAGRRFVAYLEKYGAAATALQVASPDSPDRWVDAESDLGRQIVNRIYTQSPCEIPSQCRP